MGNKLYRTILTVSITGVFIAVAILVCAIMSIIKLNYMIGGALAIIIVVCVACILSLPWIKHLEDKNKKVLSIIFISVIALCAILWIVFVVMIIRMSAKDADMGSLELNWLRISLVLTTQLLAAQTIAHVILRYKKTMIVFQVINYLSIAYIDVFFTIFLLSLNISSNGLSFKSVPDFLGSKYVLTVLFIAFLYVAISASIVKNVDRRRAKNSVDNDKDAKLDENNDSVYKGNNKKSKETLSDKLQNLKDLLESGLITKEDYEKKKGDILKDI